MPAVSNSARPLRIFKSFCENFDNLSEFRQQCFWIISWKILWRKNLQSSFVNYFCEFLTNSYGFFWKFLRGVFRNTLGPRVLRIPFRISFTFFFQKFLWNFNVLFFCITRTSVKIVLCLKFTLHTIALKKYAYVHVINFENQTQGLQLWMLSSNHFFLIILIMWRFFWFFWNIYLKSFSKLSLRNPSAIPLELPVTILRNFFKNSFTSSF